MFSRVFYIFWVFYRFGRVFLHFSRAFLGFSSDFLRLFDVF